MLLILQVFPRLFARKVLAARELLAAALENYFLNKGHESGSALIQARYNHSIEWKTSINDIARFELGGTFAVLPNTVNTSFWIIFHIFSDPVVHNDVRNELTQLIKSGPDYNSIDIADVKSKCPILLSTLQEVLRFHTNGNSVRVALEDHMLASQYLIKKNCTIMIPSAVQHTDPSIWGPTVSEFNHKRFLRSQGKRLPNPVAFRGFGGGTTLCPGRNFATTEILAFATMMVMRFDVEVVGGEWVMPSTKNAGAQATVPQPDVDAEVRMMPRKMEKEWRFELSGSEKWMELVVEDMVEK